MTACGGSDSSTDANSASPSASTDNPQNSTGDPTHVPQVNASTCDLATAKLPASELAWKPNFAGNCEVTQTISLENLQKFDTLLIAAGYEKEIISNQDFRYTIVKTDPVAETIDKDTLFFTYAMETFSGTFSGVTNPMTQDQKLEYEFTEVAKANLPQKIFERGHYSKSGGLPSFSGTGHGSVNRTDFVTQLNKFGWNLTDSPYSTQVIHRYTGSITYNGTVYTMMLDYYDDDKYYTYAIKKEVTSH